MSHTVSLSAVFSVITQCSSPQSAGKSVVWRYLKTAAHIILLLLVMSSNVKLYLKCDLFSVMKSSHKARDQLRYINSVRQSREATAIHKQCTPIFHKWWPLICLWHGCLFGWPALVGNTFMISRGARGHSWELRLYLCFFLHFITKG